jgi:hypothetical protein
MTGIPAIIRAASGRAPLLPALARGPWDAEGVHRDSSLDELGAFLKARRA